MKTILMGILLLAQVQASFANEGNFKQDPLAKCAKEVCHEPTFNEGLKRYCELVSNEDFENQVDDWGPNIHTANGDCWCSCMYDVNRI